MNSLEKKFNVLKREGKKILIVYITAGDPDIEKTKLLVQEIDKQGADAVELGIPFSDPAADGPTIQKACLRSLKKGVTLKKIISLVDDLRQYTQIPIILMGHYNPIYRYNPSCFIADSLKAGVNGLIVADLPPEEDSAFIKEAQAKGLATIFLLAPTSPIERIKFITKMSRGFIYYISLMGVTGVRNKLDSTIKEKVNRIRCVTDLPIIVGFGISNPNQARDVALYADGVIVGSAVVNLIEKYKDTSEMLLKVGEFIKKLKQGIESRF